MQSYSKVRTCAMFRCILWLTILVCPFAAHGADPTATKYSAGQCAGSSSPYPTVDPLLRAVPDSLAPVYLSHVGRHGARFISSSKYTTLLLRHLNRADSTGTITKKGRELKAAVENLVKVTDRRWGALDSLGMAEQRAIASRTHQTFPTLFRDTRISAISSYVPRCIASMDEFTHQLTRLDNKVEIYTSSGRQNNALMRPWTNNAEYKAFVGSAETDSVYMSFARQVLPADAVTSILGERYVLQEGEIFDIAVTLYKVIAGAQAVRPDLIDPMKFLTLGQYNALWAISNLDHYLRHSASTLSTVPMELATGLLTDIVEGLDRAAEGKTEEAVMLRFGHAETLMPLLALMRLKGCYYMTNYFDTVGLHWRDFDIVPMAANIQMALLRSKSGRLYLRTELNEVPVPLIPGRSDIYVPWSEARSYLLRCLPLYLQP